MKIRIYKGDNLVAVYDNDLNDVQFSDGCLLIWHTAQNNFPAYIQDAYNRDEWSTMTTGDD